MKIEHALDWDKVSTDLRQQLSKIDYNPDLKRMFRNIEKMVTELSKLEVSFRRSGKYSILEDKVIEINTTINHLEKLILMAQLMK
jgi:hypothetical protein